MYIDLKSYWKSAAASSTLPVLEPEAEYELNDPACSDAKSSNSYEPSSLTMKTLYVSKTVFSKPAVILWSS